jgi:hypothetical protein
MNVKLTPLDEISAGLKDFEFIETKNNRIPIMGRIIIGTSPGDPGDPNWKTIVLEIGLEKGVEAIDYQWYWEISIRDSSTTEFVSKNHNTGYTAKFRPSCVGCTCRPMELQGDVLTDFSPEIMADIAAHFDVDAH